MKTSILCAAVLCLACCGPRGRAAEAEPFTMKDDAAKAPGKGRDDTATVLYRCDFEEGAAGWAREEWAEYKPWNEVAHVKGERAGFRGSSGCLKTTNPNTWDCLGPYVKVEYPGTDTYVTFAYFTKDCHSVTGQGDVPALKRKLHGYATTFRDGAWIMETVPIEKWVGWNGSETGKGRQFNTLMIYAGAIKGRLAPYFLLDDVVLWSGKDATPPGRVAEASAAVDRTAGEVALSWKAPGDNVAVAQFHIHRGVTQDFVPSARNLVGSTSLAEFRDGSINNFGTYYYRWTAEDPSGNLGEPSKPLKVAVTE